MTRKNTPRWQPGRGREQLEALRKLYRSSDSTAPAAANTARLAVGEIVEVSGLADRFEVVSTADSAIIVLRNAAGVELRVGERQIVRVEGGSR